MDGALSQGLTTYTHTIQANVDDAEQVLPLVCRGQRGYTVTLRATPTETPMVPLQPGASAVTTAGTPTCPGLLDRTGQQTPWGWTSGGICRSEAWQTRPDMVLSTLSLSLFIS